MHHCLPLVTIRLPLVTPSVGDNGESKFERTGDHHFTIITQTNQPAEIFHSLIFI